MIFKQKEKRNALHIPLLVYYTRSVGELNPSCRIDNPEYFPIYEQTSFLTVTVGIEPT